MRKFCFYLRLLFLALGLSALSAMAQAPDGYYKSAEGLKQKALLAKLCDIVGPHTVVSYDGLWEVFEESDVRPGTNYYWDMYSTSKYPLGQKKCGSASKVGDCVNREHSFPKSWFGGSRPMYSDAFHLYPTDGRVNNQRSNYPFGECANGTTLPSANGVDALGRLGSSTFPGYSGKVFEPVDEYKGDFARSYFYMAAAYNDKIAGWSSPMLAGNNYPCYTTWAINLLLKWNEQDPVSDKEIARNNVIYKYQKNRNPFIDYPELADYIWGDRQSEAWTPGGVVAPKIISPYNGDNYDMGITTTSRTLSKQISVSAQGLTQPLTVGISGTGFSCTVATISASAANAGTTLTVNYSSAVEATALGTLTLTSSEVSSTVTFKAQAVTGIIANKATDITANSFVANWVDVSGDGSNYSLSVYLADGTTLLPGYPKSVAAAAQAYLVGDLDYSATYKYQLSSASGLTSNVVSVTTADPDRWIAFNVSGDEVSISALPNVASQPLEIELLAEYVEEPQINVAVTGGFELSLDKSTWTDEISVDTETAETIGATFYLRLPAVVAGSYSGALSAFTPTLDGAEIAVSAIVQEPVTFCEDFENPGAAPYSTFEYEGTACRWNMVQCGIASRTNDKFNGTQGLCTAKSSTASSFEMKEDKMDGAGTLSFMAAPYGSDTDIKLAVSYSVDYGSTWLDLTTFDIPASTTLQEYSVNVNVSHPVRFRFVRESGSRLNIDDITITSMASSKNCLNYEGGWDAYAVDHRLRIDTDEPRTVAIYTIDALEVMTLDVTATAIVDLPAGYYIVVSGNDAHKVAIR